MENGPWLKDSSDRLVKLGIGPVTPGLQGDRFIHYIMAAPTVIFVYLLLFISATAVLFAFFLSANG